MSVFIEETTGNLYVPPELQHDLARLQQIVCADPSLLDQLLQRNPTLAEAVLSETTELLASFVGEARAAEETSRPVDPGAAAAREARIAAANSSIMRVNASHPELNQPITAAKLELQRNLAKH